MCVIVLSAPWIASAQPIVVGPYTFPDETPFADTAAYHGNPSGDPLEEFLHWIPFDSGPSSLVGHSPRSGFTNLGVNRDGMCVSGETIDFGFTDVLAVNGPGPDIVIFDGRFSDDDYEIAVRPVGGGMTPSRFEYIADQRYTGAAGPSSSMLWGVEVDLSDFGIRPGIEVDLVRVIGDCSTAPSGHSQVDPVMAAVLRSTCACEDGNECTWDCAPDGSCEPVPHDPGTPCSTGLCDGAPSPACVECIEHAHCPGDRPRCDVTARVCVECLAPGDCDDERECTSDACTAGVCGHEPMPAGAPCTDGMCDGASEPTCLECLDGAHCDDGVECTIDECVGGACISVSASRGTECTDGVCDGDPSAPRCAPCASNADCADEFTPFCGDDGTCVVCREDADCRATAECVAGGACVSGTCAITPLPAGAPCAGGVCDGDAVEPACVCRIAAHCDDGDVCTHEVCDAASGTCEHRPICIDAGHDAGDAGLDDARPRGCSCTVTSSRASIPWRVLAAAVVLATARRRRARSRD